MVRRYIPVERAFETWRADLAYLAAFDSLEAEFAIASALINPQPDAELTREQPPSPRGSNGTNPPPPSK